MTRKITGNHLTSGGGNCETGKAKKTEQNTQPNHSDTSSVLRSHVAFVPVFSWNTDAHVQV